MLAQCSFTFEEDWQVYLQGKIVPVGVRDWRNKMATLFLNMVVYQVWRERNHRLHNQTGQPNAARRIARVKNMFKEKLISSENFKKRVTKGRTLVLLLN